MKKDYSKYRWNELVEDDFFCQWVLNADENNSKEWENIQAQNPNLVSEVIQAKEFIYSLKYKKLKARIGSKEKIWSQIQNQISHETPKSNTKRFFRYALAAAASLALIMYFSFFRTELIIESSPLAENRLIRLPDSSFVTLNAGSEIQYDRLSYAKERKIKLKGEAYFQVKKGSNFTVTTDLGKVRVLGTTFNVYSRKDIMSITCMTGKVAVLFFTQQKEYILTQGMKISTESNKVSSSTIDLEQYQFWRDGYFYYENAPLTQVMEELQRQYQIKDLKFSNNILKYRYTGFFKKDQFDNALQSVFLPLKLKAEFSNGVLSIQE